MIAIGIIGSIGSGKGVIGNYLVKHYDFYRVLMGNVVRAVARREGVPINRENLQMLGKKMREKHGNDYYINLVVEKARKSKKQRVVIDGMRFYEDVTVAKRELDAKIIQVEADAGIRFKRLQKRGRKGFATTLEKFEIDEKNEPGYNELQKTLKLVNYKISNNGTQQDLYKQLDNLMSELKVK